MGLLLMVWLGASLPACEAKQGEVQRVRCPACGYKILCTGNLLAGEGANFV